MADNGTPAQIAKVTINGSEVETEPGRLLIDVAEEMGVFVPRFCYHPGLDPVAACRMCLVQIEGSKRPLEPACATPVTDGMVVRTDSETAVEAQKSVLELLLINHPLDCPVCDRGGECPLQDQTLSFGPGSSRYVEEKRHFPKPLPISDLVMLDRERCVLCWRCVRFSEEVAGDPFIDLMDRGSHAQINTAATKPFDSHFSGNTIQICPVGALTSASYRFLSRPWDLETAASTCSHCAVGCPLSIEHRGGEVLRAQALANDEVNSFWNCDKGRFGHRYVSHPDRLKAPIIRTSGSSKEVSWNEAYGAIADKLKQVIARRGPEAVGFIGGSHCTNEDVYAAARFFRDVVGTRNLDFRTFDTGFPYEAIGDGGVIGSTARMEDLDSAKTIVWLGPDPKEELPVLYLRLRSAASRGAKLIVVHPRRISLAANGIHLGAGPKDQAALIKALREGGEVEGVDPSALTSAQEALRDGGVVVCVGQQFIGVSHRAAIEQASELITATGAKVLLCVPNANSQGAIDMGLHPHADSGHRRVQPGLDTTQMLRAAADRTIRFLWIMGADLVTDFPDASLVQDALTAGTFVVVSELFPTATSKLASVVLPAEASAEKRGSFTNLERRIQKLDRAVAAPGIAVADWKIFNDLASKMDRGFGWSTSADVADAIAREVPTHAEFAWENLAEPPDPGTEAGAGTGARGAWPLSWELRAVDATRRHGWIWPLPAVAAAAPSVQRADEAEGEPRERRRRDFPLTLLVARALYDGGAMVSRSPELRNVTKDAFVELHPAEASARGLTAGQDVSVASSKGSVNVKLRISADTPVGCAFIAHDLKGVHANELLDVTDLIPAVEVIG